MVIADELRRRFEPIEPWDFYHEIFRDGELDAADAFTKGKYTAIAVEITDQLDDDGKAIVWRHTVTDDLDEVDAMIHRDNFCIMAPISYIGKSRKSENARIMYALCVELDHLLVKDYDGEEYQEGLWNLVYQWDGEGGSNYLPRPTFCVASGSGIHLYYVFEKPLILYPNVIKGLAKYKKELTRRIWNRYTTTDHDEKLIQYESIFQAFRMPGTVTKKKERAQAFRTGELVSVEYLNKFIPDSYRKKGAEIPEAYKSATSLREAQEKWPEWYERRVVNGDKSRRYWDIPAKVHGDNPHALYDWWYRQIYDGAMVGKRYYCILALVIMAIKAKVPYERLRDDAYRLQERFDEFAKEPQKYADVGVKKERSKAYKDNRFTKEDIEAALLAYDNGEHLNTYPIKLIMYRTGIVFEPNKRNGRPQEKHLAGARALQAIDDPEGRWRNKNGRPSVRHRVIEWREQNPDGTKYRCIKETQLDKKTVYKWWNAKAEEQEAFAAARRSMDDLADCEFEEDLFRAPRPQKSPSEW